MTGPTRNRRPCTNSASPGTGRPSWGAKGSVWRTTSSSSAAARSNSSNSSTTCAPNSASASPSAGSTKAPPCTAWPPPSRTSCTAPAPTNCPASPSTRDSTPPSSASRSAGGHGLVYRGLATHLPDHTVIGFNYLPGDDKTARYADLIEAAQPEGACLLLGYSLGGNLAFETAKELERRGRRVAHVVILDSRRILTAYEPDATGIAAFESELAEHLRRHTGSEAVTQETLAHAAEYLAFCGRTPNTGTVTATVTVITDEDKATLYAAGERGTWHGSSTTATAALRGSGSHADMLDAKHLRRNAELVRSVLKGDAAHGG